jgi:hypothetical protein
VLLLFPPPTLTFFYKGEEITGSAGQLESKFGVVPSIASQKRKGFGVCRVMPVWALLRVTFGWDPYVGIDVVSCF